MSARNTSVPVFPENAKLSKLLSIIIEFNVYESRIWFEQNNRKFLKRVEPRFKEVENE
jgi:hypothetical protein